MSGAWETVPSKKTKRQQREAAAAAAEKKKAVIDVEDKAVFAAAANAEVARIAAEEREAKAAADAAAAAAAKAQRANKSNKQKQKKKQQKAEDVLRDVELVLPEIDADRLSATINDAASRYSERLAVVRVVAGELEKGLERSVSFRWSELPTGRALVASVAKPLSVVPSPLRSVLTELFSGFTQAELSVSVRFCLDNLCDRTSASSQLAGMSCNGLLLLLQLAAEQDATILRSCLDSHAQYLRTQRRPIDGSVVGVYAFAIAYAVERAPGDAARLWATYLAPTLLSQGPTSELAFLGPIAVATLEALLSRKADLTASLSDGGPVGDADLLGDLVNARVHSSPVLNVEDLYDRFLDVFVGAVTAMFLSSPESASAALPSCLHLAGAVDADLGSQGLVLLLAAIDRLQEGGAWVDAWLAVYKTKFAESHNAIVRLNLCNRLGRLDRRSSCRLLSGFLEVNRPILRNKGSNIASTFGMGVTRDQLRVVDRHYSVILAELEASSISVSGVALVLSGIALVATTVGVVLM